MDKVRISEIAQELGLESKEVLGKAKEIEISAKAANSAVTVEQAEQLMNYILTGKAPQKKELSPKAKPEKKAAAAKKEKTEAAPKAKKAEKKKTTAAKPAPKPQKEEKEIVEAEVVEPVKEVKTPKATTAAATPAKEQKAPETLAQSTLKKRRGLVIVKKKRPVKTEAQKAAEAERFKMPEAIPGMTKKKKKTKKVPASGKKEQAEKIEIFGGGNFANIELLSEEEMVVLHDFDLNVEEEKPKETATKKRFDANQMRTTKKASFMQQTGIRRGSKKRRKRKKEEGVPTTVSHIEIPEDIRVYEFAEKLGKPTSEVIKALFTLGVMVTKNDFLDKDAIEILADEFDVDVTTVNPLDEFDYEKVYEAGSEERLEEKAPVITIMGHVDHGKTSLLDRIRSTKVASGEHGGITQHIGAYMIERNGKRITFIDTPGHEAFTAMRSRGAQATDIVVIVVAADDGVKPQTKEAIEHARAANVPFIVAINKIDKPDANPDLAKAGLAELGVTPVDWGGEYEFVNVSAKTGAGIDELLEVLQLQAEMLELKASREAKAKAIVVESALEKGRGPVATVIMQNGTLHVGDTIVCGIAYGRVRAILNEEGKNLKELHPGEPGQIIGLNEVPAAGDTLVAVENEKIAREFAQKRAEYIRQKELSRSTKVTLEELGAKIAEGQIKSLPVILKADVAGSLEAIRGSLEKLRNEEVKVDVISSGVGGITESDIALAEASEHAVILGFNVRPTGAVKEKAKKAGVEIKTYNVIYDLIDDVKALLGGMLSPITREEQLGQAEVREVFNVPKLGQVAGCMVTDGLINRGAKVRVIRDGVVIYEGEISSLKRFKEDVREVAKGYECGIGVQGYNDIKVGDYLESYKEVEEQATLE
ncbi:MAG: translation initiation factor IF-2 [Campylobacteraceae bacterium 4484_4]|nr:MAG: translation initiation factor IF-2 [Campylobacteraceae bacterium 4484_4]